MDQIRAVRGRSGHAPLQALHHSSEHLSASPAQKLLPSRIRPARMRRRFLCPFVRLISGGVDAKRTSGGGAGRTGEGYSLLAEAASHPGKAEEGERISQ